MVFGFQRMKKTGRDWSRWGPSLKKRHLKVALDVPGGPTVKNPLFNGEDSGLIPSQGTKILYAEGQFSPHTTTREMRSSCNQRSPCAATMSPQSLINELNEKVKVAQSCPTLCNPMEQSMEFSRLE